MWQQARRAAGSGKITATLGRAVAAARNAGLTRLIMAWLVINIRRSTTRHLKISSVITERATRHHRQYISCNVEHHVNRLLACFASDLSSATPLSGELQALARRALLLYLVAYASCSASLACAVRATARACAPRSAHKAGYRPRTLLRTPPRCRMGAARADRRARALPLRHQYALSAAPHNITITPLRCCRLRSCLGCSSSHSVRMTTLSLTFVSPLMAHMLLYRWVPHTWVGAAHSPLSWRAAAISALLRLRLYAAIQTLHRTLVYFAPRAGTQSLLLVSPRRSPLSRAMLARSCLSPNLSLRAPLYTPALSCCLGTCALNCAANAEVYA